MQKQSTYEIASVSFPDVPLSDQIRFGINNRCAEDASGLQFIGRTQAEAERICYEYHRDLLYSYQGE